MDTDCADEVETRGAANMDVESASIGFQIQPSPLAMTHDPTKDQTVAMDSVQYEPQASTVPAFISQPMPLIPAPQLPINGEDGAGAEMNMAYVDFNQNVVVNVLQPTRLTPANMAVAQHGTPSSPAPVLNVAPAVLQPYGVVQSQPNNEAPFGSINNVTFAHHGPLQEKDVTQHQSTPQNVSVAPPSRSTAAGVNDILPTNLNTAIAQKQVIQQIQQNNDGGHGPAAISSTGAFAQVKLAEGVSEQQPKPDETAVGAGKETDTATGSSHLLSNPTDAVITTLADTSADGVAQSRQVPTTQHQQNPLLPSSFAGPASNTFTFGQSTNTDGSQPLPVTLPFTCTTTNDPPTNKNTTNEVTVEDAMPTLTVTVADEVDEFEDDLDNDDWDPNADTEFMDYVTKVDNVYNKAQEFFSTNYDTKFSNKAVVKEPEINHPEPQPLKSKRDVADVHDLNNDGDDMAATSEAPSIESKAARKFALPKGSKKEELKVALKVNLIDDLLGKAGIGKDHYYGKKVAVEPVDEAENGEAVKKLKGRNERK
ncbi:hypothetical protein HDU76_006932 [Blyttiomyces sp. JEL0837]|nr:hypothetical protein HDU76_006932 [Blyttiomyces sp. JEL0837]